MAIKKYKAKVTATHALTGIYLIACEVYEIEESLAGNEIFEEVKQRKDSRQAGMTGQVGITEDKKGETI